MATISTENNFTGGQQESRSGNDDKEKDLDCGSVRSTTADEHRVVESDDAKSFIRYDERRW